MRKRYVSLFSGAGISDWGFHLAGWDCVAQVEIDKQANGVRKRHFPECEHFEDVRSFDAGKFRGVDAVVGGIPCQDYSVAGCRAGLAGDRGAMFWEFRRVVNEIQPEYFVIENVPGILSADKGRSFRTIVGEMVQLGYRVAWRVLDLRYFRVPQRRRRVFIVGSLGNGRSAEILFEPGCLRGDTPEGGEAGKEIDGSLGGGSQKRGWNIDLDGSGAFIPTQSGTLDARACKCPNGQDAHQNKLIPVCGTLAGSGAGTSRPAGNANEADMVILFDTTQITSRANRSNPRSGDACHTISGAGDAPAMAFSIMPMNSGKDFKARETDVAQPLMTAPVGGNQGGDYILNMGVRRLTPTECERLMALPDGYTRFSADGKEVADGPRYRMVGNGWAVPQAKWIAERIGALA